MSRIALKHILFFYCDIIYNLYQDMCTYSQLKKTLKKIVQHPPPPSPQGVNGASNAPKLYASSGTDISKCIEGGSMKLATQVYFIYICNVSRRHFRVINVFFFLIFFFYYFFTFFLTIFFYLVKDKLLRETEELLI